MGELRLTDAQIEVLTELAEHGPLSVSRSTVPGVSVGSNSVRKLEGNGLVRYCGTVDDWRAELTDAGRSHQAAIK